MVLLSTHAESVGVSCMLDFFYWGYYPHMLRDSVSHGPYALYKKCLFSCVMAGIIPVFLNSDKCIYYSSHIQFTWVQVLSQIMTCDYAPFEVGSVKYEILEDMALLALWERKQKFSSEADRQRRSNLLYISL